MSMKLSLWRPTIDLVAVCERPALDPRAVDEHAIEAAIVEDRARRRHGGSRARGGARRWGRRSAGRPAGFARSGPLRVRRDHDQQRPSLFVEQVLARAAASPCERPTATLALCAIAAARSGAERRRACSRARGCASGRPGAEQRSAHEVRAGAARALPELARMPTSARSRRCGSERARASGVPEVSDSILSLPRRPRCCSVAPRQRDACL